MGSIKVKRGLTLLLNALLLAVSVVFFLAPATEAASSYRWSKTPSGYYQISASVEGYRTTLRPSPDPQGFSKTLRSDPFTVTDRGSTYYCSAMLQISLRGEDPNLDYSSGNIRLIFVDEDGNEGGNVAISNTSGEPISNIDCYFDIDPSDGYFFNNRNGLDDWINGRDISAISGYEIFPGFTELRSRCLNENGGSGSNMQQTADMAAVSQCIQNGVSELEPPTPGEGGQADALICTGGALGWVFCPLGEFTLSVSSMLANFVEGLLIIDPLTLSTDNPIFTVWSLVRDLANVGLILVFLVVIISQITSMGLSNYGIKRILPRLIIAAILLNVSYYICALAVDVFNLLGAGVQGLFAAGIDAASMDGESPGQTEATSGQWMGFFVTAIAALTVGIYTGYIYLILPPILFVLLSLALAFVVLVIRQVLVTLLIILAPLAFLAWLAPGTSGYFDTWRKTLTTLLMTYPVVMALFYGSAFVASVINADGIASNIPGGGQGGIVTSIVSIVILALPIFILPATFKAFGGIAQRFAGFVNDPNKGAIDRFRKRTDAWRENSAGGRRRELMQSARKARRDQKWAQRRRSGGLTGAYTRGIGASADEAWGKAQERWKGSKTRGNLADRFGEDRVPENLPSLLGSKTREVAGQRADRQAGAIIYQEAAEVAKILKEEIEGARINLDNTHGNDTAGLTRELRNALQNGEEGKAAAAVSLLAQHRAVGDIQSVLDSTLSATGDEGVQQRSIMHKAVTESLGDLTKLAPDVAQFAKTPRAAAVANSDSLRLDDFAAKAYSGASANDLGGTRLASIEKGISTGAINPATAYSALTDKDIVNNMKVNVAEALKNDPVYGPAIANAGAIETKGNGNATVFAQAQADKDTMYDPALKAMQVASSLKSKVPDKATEAERNAINAFISQAENMVNSGQVNSAISNLQEVRNSTASANPAALAQAQADFAQFSADAKRTDALIDTINKR